MYDIDIKDALYFIVICAEVTWQNDLFYRQQIAYTPYILRMLGV